MKKKIVWLKIINPILALSFLIQVLTGIFHEQLPYELFSETHEINGFVMTLLVLIHIILNWDWIRNVLLRRRA